MRYTKGNFSKIEDKVTRVLASNDKDVEFLIDIEDWERVKHFTWGVSVKGYITTVVILEGRHTTIMLHSFLIGKPLNHLQIDHWNRNKLDNRKKNLRIVTPSLNAINRSLRAQNVSGFRGVAPWWWKKSQKWQAQITVNKERMSLGLFEHMEDAIKARLEAERKYLGEEIDLYDDEERTTND